MKRIFTFAIALMSMFAALQTASALVYNVTVPAGTFVCYIAGSMTGNGTDWARVEMTKVDATHFTITIATATELDKYKYLSGPTWDFEEYNGSGGTISDRTYSAADVVLEWKAIYNPTVIPVEKDVFIQVMVPDSIIECYIAGSFDSWAGPVAANKMTKGTPADGTVIFSKTIHTLDSATLEYKFCAGPAWDYEMLDPSANFKYSVVGDMVIVNSFKMVFDPAKTGTINITATVPAGTQRVWAMGSHLSWNWDNLVEGTKNTDGTFSFSFPMVMSIQYRLYNFNLPAWGFPEVAEATPTVELTPRVATYPADANIAITVWGWKAEAPNAIAEIKAATNVIYSLNSTIIVEGVNAEVGVFDIAGRSIQTQKMTGTFTSKALNSGLYIIRVDGATRKVAVK